MAEALWSPDDYPASMAPGASAFLTQRPATRQELEQAAAQLTGAVVVVTGTHTIAKPWGLSELGAARPAYLFHGDAVGADRMVAQFFAKLGGERLLSQSPAEVRAYALTDKHWRDAPGQAGMIRNGVMLADAISTAQDQKLPVVGLVRWDGVSPGTATMRGRMIRAKVPMVELRQLPASTDAWFSDQRLELEERADRHLDELALTLADLQGPAGEALRRRAWALGEASVRREYAWRRAREDGITQGDAAHVVKG